MGRTLCVLTYHRVASPEAIYPSDPRLVSATPEMFVKHMEHLARYYHVVDMSTVLDAVVSSATLPRRAVLITFDDAYPDFLEHAWPTLRKFDLPATLFVPTSFPGQQESEFWWDRLYAAVITTKESRLVAPDLGQFTLNSQQSREHCVRVLQNYVKSLPHNNAMAWVDDICERLVSQKSMTSGTLSWGELKLLSNEGVTICAHSRTHPLMTRINYDQVQEEVAGSLKDLEDNLGNVLPVFCYPAGAYNKTVCQIARDNGILLGFSVTLGHNRINSCDPLTLKRINITKRTNPIVLSGRLSRIGIYADIWRNNLKQRLRSN